jgi:ABC-type sugar transport system ATPase subunit
MFEVELENIRKSYGSEPVLDGVNLRFERGRFSVVLGSPVSGKSVLMRLIMGLEPPDSGRVLYRGQDVTAQPAGLRNFGYVPQSFALYPHYRVFDNIAYPLILAKKKTDLQARVESVAKKLRIDHLLSKYPNQLSGGEKQRVALARGMIKDSSVFILDDPLVGLDFKLRESLFIDLRDMLSEVEGSVIYSTSDPLETLALADDVFVLDDHRIIESGSLDQLYEEPRQARTLQILGVPPANFIEGELAGRICRTSLGECEIDVTEEATATRSVRIGIRAEDIRFQDFGSSYLLGNGRVLLREDLGAETLLYFEAGGSRFVGFWSNGEPAPIKQDQFEFGVDPNSMHVFDAANGTRVTGIKPAGALV